MTGVESRCPSRAYEIEAAGRLLVVSERRRSGAAATHSQPTHSQRSAATGSRAVVVSGPNAMPLFSPLRVQPAHRTTAHPRRTRS